MPGLRERKKQRTREAIVAAALRLFEERGFERTTVADIADAADVSPRTFHGYFPSKEAVLFWDFEESFGGLDARMRERAEGESAIDAMRAWIAGMVADKAFDDEEHRRRRCLVDETPALAVYDRRMLARFEDLLADAIATDLGEAQGSLRARMAAAAASAALTTLDKSDADDVMEQVDEALAFVRAGIEALRRQDR